MLYFILNLFKLTLQLQKKLLSLYKNGLIYMYVYSHIFKMTLYSIIFYSGQNSNINNSYLIMINSIILVTLKLEIDVTL